MASPASRPTPARPPRASNRRAAILFLDFFLIILAYYQVKSASRSLLIEHWGADALAYVWILSACTLGLFISWYHHLVARASRLRVVLGSCVAFALLLAAFHAGLASLPAPASLAFYVFVDIFSVILVEQFWSLTNSITETSEGRRSYWLVGTGGLVGGVAGGATSAAIVRFTPLGTTDLLLVCAALLVVAFGLTLLMGRMGLYAEVRTARRDLVAGEGLRALAGSRYIRLVAVILLCAQVAQPVVDYQFLKSVESAFDDLDARTTYISGFFGVLGLVSIAVNLAITPVVHRRLGAIGGLLAQPVVLALASVAFMVFPVLGMAAAMKIGDRGLSYSINRASKELLYIPVDPVRTYQAKAWIDMLGYRLFKVAGSVLILLLTQWIAFPVSAGGLGWATLAICAAWLLAIARISPSYRAAVPAHA